MNDKKKVSFLKNVKIFILLLTFFILWVIFSSNIKEFYVKNIVKTNEKEVNFDNKLSIFSKKDLDLEKFWKVYSLMKKNYYDDKVIKKEDLVDWAIKWMIDAIWDKHSEFMDSEETKKFNEVLAWDFEWIGAIVEKTWVWVKIDRLIKWSPAKKAWLKKDDVLIEADWKNLVWLDLFDAVNLIKWPAWTQVNLKVVRLWEKKVLNIKVTRDKIKIPSVESKTLTWAYDKVWYIALNMFWETTSDEFEKALNDFKNKDWIIIDLRDNWWGYLQSAVQILSNFIENWKTLVETRYKNKLKNNKYISINYDNKPYEWKIVILLNQNSASASEITALALKEYKKAIIVWEKSYWKWSVQEPFSLDDGSLLKLTIAKWFSPEGKNIDWKGIEPEIKVDFKEEDYKNLFDRQLDIAKKVLKDFIDLDDKQKVIDKWKKLKEERWLTNSWTTNSWTINK
jgi:carboxyl-terminal processing protease